MYLRHDDAKLARMTKGTTQMNIVPTRIQEQVNRVDRTRSLAIGIGTGLTALWSIYRLFWLVYAATTLSSVAVESTSRLEGTLQYISPEQTGRTGRCHAPRCCLTPR